MKRDEEGFLQPVVGDGCIGCGACEKKCPVINGIQGNPTNSQQAVAAVTRDELLWQSSTSGGAFTCLCEAFAEMDPSIETVVYGASMMFPHVQHMRCEATDVSPLRKSKYVQSDKGNSLRNVRDDLIAGRRVVFSGTACEVAGAYSYLGKLAKSDRLLLVDMVCHGVGSPAVFESCMARASDELGKVVDYEFRCKRAIVGNYERHLSRYKYLDKHLNTRTRYVRIDDYNRLFLNQVCLRRSCAERCMFRNRKRFGDVTLADLNGKGALFPGHDDGRGWSTVIGNTDKGRNLISRLSQWMDVYPSSPDDVACYNPLFDHTTPGNPRRDEFFAKYVRGDDLGDLVSAFGLHSSLKSEIMIHIPHGLKMAVKRALRVVRG